MQKKRGRMRTLLLAILVAIALVPEPAFSAYSIIGSWRAAVMQNGVRYTIYLTLNGDGTATMNRYFGVNLAGSIPMSWSFDGNVICFANPDGSGAGCGTAYMPNASRLTIAMNSTITYDRVSDISFGSYTHWKCKYCYCKEYRPKSRADTRCECGHRADEHVPQ